MIKIRLFCAAGMSTSLLVKKMKEAAIKKGIEVNIEAYPESSVSEQLEKGIDIVLIGPQIRFKFKQINSLCEAKGVPVVVIDSIDYGMMKGDKILDNALKLIK